MGRCDIGRRWLLLIFLLQWHDYASGLWFVKEPMSKLPDEVDHALAVCQGSNMILNCRNRYNKIVVKETFYGRKNNHTCASKIFDTEKLCDDTTPDSIKKKVDIMCTGEYKCKVPITPAFLEKKGDPVCPGTRKYLQVTYACHQDPKLHMVCYNNCTNKCWPLCNKECCNPPPPKEERHDPPPAPPAPAASAAAAPAAAAPAAAPPPAPAAASAAAVSPDKTNVYKELTEVPQALTCRGSCPNRCAPQCDITCCETKPQPKQKLIKDFNPYASKGVSQKSCHGDCLNICAPLCRPSCCARHKKSSVKPTNHKQIEAEEQEQPPPPLNYNQFPHAPPITAPIVTCPRECNGKCSPNCPQVCCAQYPIAGNPYYVEPMTARMQCPAGCNQRCEPSCTPQCCMQYNRYQVPQPPAAASAMSPQAPGLSRTGYYGPQQPVSPAVANTQPYPLAYPQPAVARGGQTPLVAGQTLDVEIPNPNYNRVAPAQTYQRVYPGAPPNQGAGVAAGRGGLPLGCPESCARSCDANCKLGCCATPNTPSTPNTYFFSTQQINDDDQRRTYELLLQKYRNSQLQKYFQNTRQFAG